MTKSLLEQVTEYQKAQYSRELRFQEQKAIEAQKEVREAQEKKLMEHLHILLPKENWIAALEHSYSRSNERELALKVYFKLDKNLKDDIFIQLRKESAGNHNLHICAFTTGGTIDAKVLVLPNMLSNPDIIKPYLSNLFDVWHGLYQKEISLRTLEQEFEVKKKLILGEA